MVTRFDTLPGFAFKASKGAYSGTDSLITRLLPDRISDVINIKDWGATGNGTTDDTNAINAALDFAGTNFFDAAHNIGGATVYFPPGTYRITSQITFEHYPGPLMIIGAGRDVTIIVGNWDATGAQMDEIPSGFLVSTRGDGAFCIRDMTIHNESTTVTSGAFIAHEVGNNRYVENVHFIGMTGFVCQEAGFGQSVRDCVFTCTRGPTSADDPERSPRFEMANFGPGYFISGTTTVTGSAVTAITSIQTRDGANTVISPTQGVGFTPNHTYGLSFAFGNATAHATASPAGIITVADIIITSGGTGYSSLNPPGFTLIHSNVHGTVGAYIAQGMFYNCRAVGFDIGFSVVGGGTSVKCCWAYRCGIGFSMGYKNGSNTDPAALDGRIQPADWYFMNAGELTSCVAYCCTWGIHAYRPRGMYSACRVYGAVGPTTPSQILGMSWASGTNIVTVTTTLQHHLTVPGDDIQIVPASWTLSTTGIVKGSAVTVISPTQFRYVGPSSAPPTFVTGTWNYPIEYGVISSSPSETWFVGCTVDAVASKAGFAAEGNSGQGGISVWCTRGEGGWTLPDRNSFSFTAGNWIFEQCGSNGRVTPAGTTPFPAVPNTMWLPGQQINISGSSCSGDEINIINGKPSVGFGDAVYSYTYITSAAALGATSLSVERALPDYVGMNLDEYSNHIGVFGLTVASVPNSTTINLSGPITAALGAGTRIMFLRTSTGDVGRYKVRYDGDTWRRVA